MSSNPSGGGRVRLVRMRGMAEESHVQIDRACSRPCSLAWVRGVADAVETIGRITEVVPKDAESGSYALTIGDVASILDDCHIGDSIAVNGR